jgi:hypothetical protein
VGTVDMETSTALIRLHYLHDHSDLYGQKN